jgi:hypothetical protein
LIYSRVVPLIPGMQNDDRQAYFTEEIVNNFLASPEQRRQVCIERGGSLP